MSLRFALERLPPAMRAQAEAKLRVVGKARVVIGGKTVPEPITAPAPEPTPVVATPPRPRARRSDSPYFRHLKSISSPVGRLAWHCRLHGIPPFVPEFRFHPTRQWRFDAAWPEHKLAVEIEGVTPEGGRHQRIGGFIEDMRKYNAAAVLGWRLLRVTPQMVKSKSMEAIRLVEQAFDRGKE